MELTSILGSLAYTYFALAIGYNLASIGVKELTGKALAPTDPMNAIVMMSVLFLIYSATTILDTIARTLLMSVFLILIIRYGIFAHVMSYSSDVYHSRLSWCSAIVINIFGVCVLSLSLINA